MSSKFSQMRPLVSMATDRVTVGKTVFRIREARITALELSGILGLDDIRKFARKKKKTRYNVCKTTQCPNHMFAAILHIRTQLF